jgi:hypothetical protein
MRVLYIASNPKTQRSLQIEEEANELQTKIDAVMTSGTLDLRIYSKLRVADLPQTIARVQPDVIHFSAHGEFDGIILSHDEEEVLLSGEDLCSILLALGVRPKLIVVNACSSEAVAKALVNVSDFTIGTTAPITNSGAIVMAATLYQHLAASASIQAAFDSARAMLNAVDAGKVTTCMFVAEGKSAASTRLNETFRILAALPAIDGCLKDGAPLPKFKPRAYEVEFGVADAPASASQLVFFTDDSSVVADAGRSLEEVRSWVQEVRPQRGEHWISPTFEYYGDMQWYATIVTADTAFFSAKATTCEALERYYFDEGWAGPLDDSVKRRLREILNWLRSNDGSRRAQFSAIGSMTAMVQSPAHDDSQAKARGKSRST